MVDDKQLIRWYRRGFYDEFRKEKKFLIPDNKLLEAAMRVGFTHAYYGDDVPNIDYKSMLEILQEIHNLHDYLDRKNKISNIKEKVYGFKTKNKKGFTMREISTLLKDYPNINSNKFNEAMIGVTCIMCDSDIVMYRSDVEKALYCATLGSLAKVAQQEAQN